jgi:hypothetical protein
MAEHTCSPGCNHGITPENEALVKEEFHEARRSFLKDAFAVGGSTAALGALGRVHSLKAQR